MSDLSQKVFQLVTTLKKQFGDAVQGAAFRLKQENINPAYVIYLQRKLTPAEETQFPTHHDDGLPIVTEVTGKISLQSPR